MRISHHQSLFFNVENMENEIGLKRGTVKLSEHNPRWKEFFEQEKGILFKKFPKVILEIQHGGSTAIHGIPAKPIIDMFAVVSSLKDAEEIKPELEALGYEYRGEEGVPERRLYVKGSQEKRTHHLQLVERNSNEWKNHILIREYYLKHPDVAQQYAELKKKLAERYPDDRPSYGAGKDAFIKSVIENAKKEFES